MGIPRLFLAPQHYICWSELPTPRISVTFSLQEVEEIERDCAVYRGRVEMIAKHSATSREEQVTAALSGAGAFTGVVTDRRPPPSVPTSLSF